MPLNTSGETRAVSAPPMTPPSDIQKIEFREPVDGRPETRQLAMACHRDNEERREMCCDRRCQRNRREPEANPCEHDRAGQCADHPDMRNGRPCREDQHERQQIKRQRRDPQQRNRRDVCRHIAGDSRSRLEGIAAYAIQVSRNRQLTLVVGATARACTCDARVNAGNVPAIAIIAASAKNPTDHSADCRLNVNCGSSRNG